MSSASTRLVVAQLQTVPPGRRRPYMEGLRKWPELRRKVLAELRRMAAAGSTSDCDVADRP